MARQGRDAAPWSSVEVVQIDITNPAPKGAFKLVNHPMVPGVDEGELDRDTTTYAAHMFKDKWWRQPFQNDADRRKNDFTWYMSREDESLRSPKESTL